MNKVFLCSFAVAVFFVASLAHAESTEFLVQNNCLVCDAVDGSQCWITATVQDKSATAARIYHWENVIVNNTYEANSICFVSNKSTPAAYYNLILNDTALDYGHANLTLYFNSINVTANATLYSNSSSCGKEKGRLYLKAKDFIAIEGGALKNKADIESPAGKGFSGVTNLCGDVILEAPTIYVDGVVVASDFLKIQNPGTVNATTNSVLRAGKGIQVTGKGGSESHFDGFMAGGLDGDSSWCCLLDEDCDANHSGLAIDLPDQKIFLGGFAAALQCDARLRGQTISLVPASESPAKSFFDDNSFGNKVARQLNVSNGRLFVFAGDFESDENISSAYTQAFNLTGRFRLGANASLSSLKHVVSITSKTTGDSEILGAISAFNQRPDLSCPGDQLGLNNKKNTMPFNSAVLLNFFNGGLTINNSVNTSRGRIEKELYFNQPSADLEAAKNNFSKWKAVIPLKHQELGCVKKCTSCISKKCTTEYTYFAEECDEVGSCPSGYILNKIPVQVDYYNESPAWHLDNGKLSFNSVQFEPDINIQPAVKRLRDVPRYFKQGDGYNISFMERNNALHNWGRECIAYNSRFSPAVPVGNYSDPLGFIALAAVQNAAWTDVTKDFCGEVIINLAKGMGGSLNYSVNGEEHSPVVLDTKYNATTKECYGMVAWLNGTKGWRGDSFNALLGQTYSISFKLCYGEDSKDCVETVPHSFIAGANPTPDGVILLNNSGFGDFDFRSKIELQPFGNDSGGNFVAQILRYNESVNGGKGGYYFVTASGGNHHTTFVFGLNGNGWNGLAYSSEDVVGYNVTLWYCNQINKNYFAKPKDGIVNINNYAEYGERYLCDMKNVKMLATAYVAPLDNSSGYIAPSINPYYLRTVADGCNFSVYLSSNGVYDVKPLIKHNESNCIERGQVGFQVVHSNAEIDLNETQLLERTRETGSGDIIIASKNLVLGPGADVRADYNTSPQQNPTTGGNIFIFGRDMTLQANNAEGCNSFYSNDACKSFNPRNAGRCKPYVYTNPCNPAAFFFRLGCGLTQTFDDNNTNYYARAPTAYRQEFCLTKTPVTLFGVVKDLQGNNLKVGSIMVESIKDAAGTPVYLDYLDSSATPWTAKFAGGIVDGSVMISLGAGGSASNPLLYLFPAATYYAHLWVSDCADDSFSFKESTPCKRHKYVVKFET